MIPRHLRDKFWCTVALAPLLALLWLLEWAGCVGR